MYYIIGSGGFAKEVLFLCKEVFGNLNGFRGFIGHKTTSEMIRCFGIDFPLIDENTFLSSEDFGCDLFLGIGNPKKISEISIKYNVFNFPNLIHPNVIIGENILMGKGNIITAGCVLTVDINIGDFNIINLNTTIGHDTLIEDFNVFNPGTNISGSVKVGHSNLFGTNSTVLQGLIVGNNNVIGASSLINRNVDSNVVIVGVPGKKIKINE
jgi:sugar O-acyltransferase (sialic acid O-acetyltransferase NeuD family)